VPAFGVNPFGVFLGDDMKSKRALVLKGGAICGFGTLASIIPSTMGLSAAVASSNVETTMHVQSVALLSTSKAVHTKKKALSTKKKIVKKVRTKKATGTTGSFLGQETQTQFGPVQVRVSVSKGRITKVSTPIYPVGTYRDQAINSQAIPMLEQQVMQVQSSKIQGVGGASYTSQGFYTSLLSALAKAGHK